MVAPESAANLHGGLVWSKDVPVRFAADSDHSDVRYGHISSFTDMMAEMVLKPTF